MNNGSRQTEIQGQLERITFHNEENHYTIAKIRVQGRKDLITVVGSLVSVQPGEELKISGFWDMHAKYGEQFRVVSYETVIPATVKGIERYLGSGLIKGIGPVMAKRLVGKFGLDTLDIIEKDTNRLQEVDGIGEKRIAMIRQAWSDQKEIRDVMLFLQGHEVSSSYAAKIYKQYGRDSIRVVKENPYRLASDIFGIGFLIADGIAGKLGVPHDSQVRAEAGIMYVLTKLSEEGHVYYPYNALLEECENMLGIPGGIITRALGATVAEKKVVIEDLTGTERDSYDGVNNKAVYLSELHAAETAVAGKLTKIATAPGSSLSIDADRYIADIQKELSIALAPAQTRAIRNSLNHKVMVITGGPGTGKTTIIRVLTMLHSKMGKTVLLAAPTGRAAKRLSEAAGRQARTIHRLLEFSPKQGGFKKNEEAPLEAGVIVIDEVSMVDSVLMQHLLNAVPPSATLILVGDADQLPSVGPGNVLGDIIGSGRVPTEHLSEIFRQSSESLIIVNAHKINRGEFPVLASNREIPQDFYFIELEEPEKVCEMIIDMCCRKIPEKFGFHPLDDIQVLAPMHRGIVGAANLNTELQKRLNNSGEELVRGGKTFKKGDKVMQIRNDYDRDVFNGDIGKISSIDMEAQELVVDFDGNKVSYDFADLDEIALAYAVSVHKSQGSEYPVVVMPLLTQHYMMLQRNLLYTAITRGKKLVVIIGTKKALAIAIKNNRPANRYTRLRARLQTAGA